MKTLSTSRETGNHRLHNRPTWRALLIAAMFVFSGCELLEQIAGQSGTERPLTNSEVIEGFTLGNESKI